MCNPKLPTKDINGCPRNGSIGKASCTGLEACSQGCILFGVKKPWVDGGYDKGIESDYVFSGVLQKLLKEWEGL